MSRPPWTHCMESLQPFRASRTECIRHAGGFWFVGLFVFSAWWVFTSSYGDIVKPKWNIEVLSCNCMKNLVNILQEVRSLMTSSYDLYNDGKASDHWRIIEHTYCCSVTQSYPTLCNPMDCSMPSFPVLHHLLEFAQTHIHWAGDAIQPSPPLSSPSPPAFSLSQRQVLFHWGGSSHQVAKVLEFQLQHQSFQWLFRVDFL